MRHDPKKLLYDMKQAADRIVRFTAGRTHEEFLADDFFRSAVERQFEIIGEAMTRLRRFSPKTADRITNANKIAGFRNNLIHGYDTVNSTITWNVVVNHLGILRTELDALLAEPDEPAVG
ncbi:MAG TPA: HepT-like ribonuclease domain-containing protein [Humisphaera sp.]|jgi:uncharacterized protein with HEPN domain|nr:HepT-like ribonuclease domain-containing protein [Humisphaera sp.]